MPDNDASYGILIDGSHMSVTDAAKAMVRLIDAHPSLVSDKHYSSSDIYGFWKSEAKDNQDEMIWYVDRIIDHLNDYENDMHWFIDDNSLFRMNTNDSGNYWLDKCCE